ncbi:MAG: right-handed parallel beta-helix repeat-containing protein, partial [candidate division WOR-3 bacterium]
MRGSKYIMPIILIGLIGSMSATIINVPDDYLTIQAAINAAADGDTIQVAAGTYYENQIVINKAVTVLGAGYTSTIIDGSGASLTTNGLIRIIATTGNVMFSGFTVQNAGGPPVTDPGDGKCNVGIYTQSDVAGVTYTVSYNKIIGTNNPNDEEDYGLYSHSGKESLNFHHNIITQTGANAIVLEKHTGPIDISYNELNAGVYAADAIFIMTYGGTDITSSQNIDHNTIDLSTGISGSTARATGVTIASSFNYQANGNGKFTNVRITNNNITGVKAYRRGISLWNGDAAAGEISNVVITGNTITGTGPNTENCRGIQIINKITNATITNNTITNTYEAIKGFDYSPGSGPSTNILLNYNNIYNNHFGVSWPWSTAELNAKNNWWGHASGPYHSTNPTGQGDTISDYVDYSPWLGYQVGTSPMTYYVNTTGTIQEAIAVASAGDSIIVTPGTYNETITFATVNNLTITGSDPSNRPIVNGGVKFANTTPLNGLTLKNLYFKGDADPGSYDQIFYHANTDSINNFTMDNCVLDGENDTDRTGIKGNKHGGSLTITNCEFKNILGWAVMDIDASTASGHPWGDNEFPFTTVIFANNQMHDCNGSIALRGNYITRTQLVQVYGNVINNIGGNQGQQGEQWAGIEINHAIKAVVYDNNVSNVAMGEYGEGQAFQFWDVETLDMHDNTLTNNYQGIWIFGGSAGGGYGGPYAIPRGSIYHNNICGNRQYGIAVEATATGDSLKAENNWWGHKSGPYHATLNPSGQGDTILGKVDFIPWLPG